ncbi:hypothetical protein BOX15_Mlig027211g1, partial [Macrostomum lignano]
YQVAQADCLEMLRPAAMSPSRLFKLLLAIGGFAACCLAVLALLGGVDSSGYRLTAEEATQRPASHPGSWGQRQRPQLQPQPVRELLPYLSGECSGRAPCVAFGSPLFHRWRGWLPLVDTWLAGGQADCGFACEFIADASAADAVLFHGRDLQPRLSLGRSLQQFWVYVNMESPLATRRYGYNVAADPKFRFLFNWTATTLRSSSIPLAYEVWERRRSPLAPAEQLYSVSKKKHLAFIAFSNCKYSFNNRTAKVRELQKYMEVHVYGDCGDRRLAKNATAFRQLSELYRFYLSFENAFCRDYITEKLHANGLQSIAVPVVFGGLSRAEYEAVSPPRSFVFALDFASMKQLADHLTELAADEARYSRYFDWKRHYRASPSSAMLCAICRKLHTDSARSVADLNDFSDVAANCRPADFPYLL